MSLRVLRQRILVSLEGVSGGKMEAHTTKGGILIPCGDGFQGMGHILGQNNRWGVVLSVGSECTEIKLHDRILITAQKWTEGFVHDSIWYWLTDEEHVLGFDELYRSTNGTTKTSTDDVLHFSN